MSWIDDLEKRVGLRDEGTVLDLSAAGAAMARHMLSIADPADESLRTAAQAVIDGHQRIVEAIEAERLADGT